MENLQQRVADLEARVGLLEGRLRALAAQGGSGYAAVEAVESPVEVPAMIPSVPPASDAGSRTQRGVPATRILGWSGASALVMAAAYLIRLAMDAGWLTPARQVSLAILAAIGLIWAGLALARSNRQYASLLPAAGVSILYLAIYGAHLYYHLIGAPLTVGAVVITSLTALALGRRFKTNLYVLFAALAAYATPFLMPTLRAQVTDLVIYYTGWNLLFCVYALWERERISYLVPLYLSLVGFDVAWRLGDVSSWVGAAGYQLAQFLLFTATAGFYSVRFRTPLNASQAWVHAPALFLFYGVEYGILSQHVPQAAPWLVLTSALVLVVVQRGLSALMRQDLEAGAVLVNAYAALVLFHAGYLELVPAPWKPWVGLLLTVGVGVYGKRGGGATAQALPYLVAAAVVFVLNYLSLVLGLGPSYVDSPGLLQILYAVVLYAGYLLVGGGAPLAWARVPVLYSAHVAVLVTAPQVLDSRLGVSVLWGALAVGSLAIAIRRADPILGQSSLLIFAVSGLKVLLYDLSGSAPLIRIGILAVLGVSLYAGGWLYQKLEWGRE